MKIVEINAAGGRSCYQEQLLTGGARHELGIERGRVQRGDTERRVFDQRTARRAGGVDRRSRTVITAGGEHQSGTDGDQTQRMNSHACLLTPRAALCGAESTLLSRAGDRGFPLEKIGRGAEI